MIYLYLVGIVVYLLVYKYFKHKFGITPNKDSSIFIILTSPFWFIIVIVGTIIFLIDKLAVWLTK